MKPLQAEFKIVVPAHSLLQTSNGGRRFFFSLTVVVRVGLYYTLNAGNEALKKL